MEISKKKKKKHYMKNQSGGKTRIVTNVEATHISSPCSKASLPRLGLVLRDALCRERVRSMELSSKRECTTVESTSMSGQ